MVESPGSFPANAAASKIVDLIQPTLTALTNYQDRMARLLFEISCLEGLDELAATGRLPGAFRARMGKVMELFDESVRAARRRLREVGFTVQCQLGCPYCCYQIPTGVSSAELIFIYHGMQQSGAASKLFRRCLEVEELRAELCRRRAADATRKGALHDQVEALSESYGRLEQPCPFLAANLCQIYPFRPLACRMHFSLSPPPWCRPSHFQHPYALSLNLEPGKCVIDALEKLEDRFQLNLSGVMICGLLELIVNVMRFARIDWGL